MASGWRELPSEILVWAITKTDMRWFRSGLDTRALEDRVAALRCGLDEEEWTGIESRHGVRDYSMSKTDDKDPLPFNASVAHELYNAILAPLRSVLNGKDLLIIPSGPLHQLCPSMYWSQKNRLQ